jgi:adenosylmethionine-8-amino-7-oxononanoate aminotransferase
LLETAGRPMACSISATTLAARKAVREWNMASASAAIVCLASPTISCGGMRASRDYFGLSGSDANETNIKLIWCYNNILCRSEN